MQESSPTALIIETTTTEEYPIDFLGDAAELVYFMSFTHAERHGSDHPFTRAAGIIKRRFWLNLSPLLTFDDARPESPPEERTLESLCQEAAPLSECAWQVQVAEAIEGNRELSDMVAWAA